MFHHTTHVKQGLEHSKSQFSPCKLAASAHSHCQKPVWSPVWSPLATSKLKTEESPSHNFYLYVLAPCDPTRRERQTQKRRNLHYAVWELEVQARHPPPLKL